VFDRDEFVAFLRVIRTGDVRDPEFRQTLFDVYVSRVYVYDDTFTVDLNSGARADGYALPDPPEDPPGDAGDGVRPLEKDLHQKRIAAIEHQSFFSFMYLYSSIVFRFLNTSSSQQLLLWYIGCVDRIHEIGHNLT
jgi:hypothetical protein